MLALASSVREGRVPHTEIPIVISDQRGAAGLKSAQELGLHTLVIERLGRKRLEHDHEIVTALHEHKVDLVCLAGYMRLLSPYFVRAFSSRILNIHPSLLPC